MRFAWRLCFICLVMIRCLFDLLLQISKELGVEEILDGDSKPVAELFDGGYGGAVVPAADDVVQRGLGDPAHGAQLIDGDFPLTTQFQDAFLDRLTDIHRYHLTFCKMIPFSS